MSAEARTGRCLCGAVRYELRGALGPLVNCHCRYCRRAHGAAFATVCWMPRSALRFTAGEDRLREYRGREGRRVFCGRCGTRLFNVAGSAPDFVSLVVASLDQEPERGPVMHINLESKAGWYEILDDLPAHATLPPQARQALDEAGR